MVLEKRIKIINDKEIIIYIEGDKDITELTNSLLSPKLQIVPRDYYLYVNAKNKKIFSTCLSDIDENQYKIFSQEERFIAKVTLNSKSEFEKLLNLQTDLDIKIKPYIPNFKYKSIEQYNSSKGQETTITTYGKGNYGKGKGNYGKGNNMRLQYKGSQK